MNDPVFSEFSAHVIAYTASIKAVLRASRKLIRNISRYDFSRFTLSVASKVSHITLNTQPTAGWKTLKFLMGITGNSKYSPSRALPIAKDLDGVPVSSNKQALNLQLDYFASVELADTLSPDELIDLHDKCVNSTLVEDLPEPFTVPCHVSCSLSVQLNWVQEGSCPWR